jgi:radical SAM superfamily enzyme YgiQ (UPF0313 family)
MNNNLLMCQFDGLEYYSYMILSAKLNELNVKHDVEILGSDNNFLKKLAEEYSEYSIIGFYCCNTDYLRILTLAKEIKRRFKDKLVILGGPHPTLNSKDIDMDVIDFICVGAGEFHLADWLEEHRFKEKKNYFNIVCNREQEYKAEFVWDFDKSPFPNRELYYDKFPFLKNMGARRFMFSLGCPYKCTYCHNQTFRDAFKEEMSKKMINALHNSPFKK